jgi:hypothetical protein
VNTGFGATDSVSTRAAQNTSAGRQLRTPDFYLEGRDAVEPGGAR